jgi:hypothetical protein
MVIAPQLKAIVIAVECCRTNMYTDETSQVERLEFSFGEMRDAGWDTDNDQSNKGMQRTRVSMSLMRGLAYPS